MKKWIIRKLGALALVGALLTVSLTGCGSSDEATEADAKVEIHFAVQPGTSEFVLNDSKQYIEKAFENENVKILYDTFTGGPAIMEAMAAGDVDFAITGDVPVLSAVANGNDVVGVYRCAWDPQEEQVLALNDSGIQSVKDLVGKKVGLAFGSANHSFFLQLLEKNGYTEKDVELVNVAPADLEISLQQGDIDAGVIQESNASIIRNDLEAVCVASTDGVCESIKILSVRKSFAEKYQDYTDKVVKAFSDLDEYTIAHADEVKELLAKSNNNKVEDWASVDRYVYKGSFDDTALKNAANSIKFLVENKSISKSYEASEAFDNSYYERACK